VNVAALAFASRPAASEALALVAESPGFFSAAKAELARVDSMAFSAYGKRFIACSPEEQLELMTKIRRERGSPRAGRESSFVPLKRATINGCSTSEIGIPQELVYQGNTAPAEFECCTHDGHRNP